MGNSKNTKRALLVSILSMMVCLTMLMGSTYAWFTDSVVSGNNKIVAGNLDVELYHTNAKEVTEQKVGTDTKLFVDKEGNPVKWEPGVMVYENFKVKNVGNLAVKYQLKMSVGKFNTVEDGTKSLKDVLKVEVIPTGTFTPPTRENALANYDFDKTVADFEKNGNLLKDTSEECAVIIYWDPIDSDNAYNLNDEKKADDGTSELFIDLGVTLSATQDTVESDSFNEQYDAGAVIPVLSQQGFAEALDKVQPGDEIALSDGEYAFDKNYEVQEGISIVGDGSTKLVVDGNKDNTNADESNNKAVDINKDDVTISNVEIVGENLGNNQLDSVLNVSGNNVVIDNVKMKTSSNPTPILINNTESDDNVITIKNSEILARYKAIYMVEGAKGTVKVENSTIRGIYPISTNGASIKALEASNSTFIGESSCGGANTKATYTNCTFEAATFAGYKTGTYLAACDTEFVDCTFADNFNVLIQNNLNKTLKFKNCYKNGTKITAENVNELFHVDSKNSIDQVTSWTVIVE